MTVTVIGFNSFKIVFLAAVLGTLFSTAAAQSLPDSSLSQPRIERAQRQGDNLTADAPLEEEMRAKRAIKFAEKEHEENVDRAREVAELGVWLRDAYKQSQSIGRGEQKKLDRLEKLAKRIRSEAGGSEDEYKVENPPGQLSSSVDRLAEVCDSLHKNVEKTPRQVISAAVIGQANELLELIQIVRRFAQ
jgi:DNA anti-recombination protein RmuC